jgi:hypothetical protein
MENEEVEKIELIKKTLKINQVHYPLQMMEK